MDLPTLVVVTALVAGIAFIWWRGRPSTRQKERPRGQKERPRRRARVADATLDEDIARLPDGAERVAAVYNRGLRHRNDENLRRAIVHFDDAARIAPAFGLTYLNRGACFAVLEDYQAAIADCDRAIALLASGEERAFAFLNRATCRDALGDLHGAAADIASARKLAPEHPGVRSEQRRIREKLVAGDSPAPAPDRSAESLLQAGWAHKENGDPLSALVLFHQAVERDPTAAALYARGVANCVLNRHDDAIADLDRSIALRPRFAAAFCERGLARAKRKELERAHADYDAALDLDPASVAAIINKSSALCMADRGKEALPYFDRALRLAPSIPGPRYNRAVARENEGDLQGARDDLETCLRLSPPSAPWVPGARMRLERLLAKLDEAKSPAPSLAAETWTEVVTVTPETTVAELVQAVRAKGAFFVIVTLAEGRKAVLPVYAKGGLRTRLTGIADEIGARILPLRLSQLPDLALSCTPVAPGEDRTAALERARESGGSTVVEDGDRTLGVFCADPTPDGPPALPTELFAVTPIFRGPGDARKCPSCQADAPSLDPVLRDGLLADYACPACEASPIPARIEARMLPGRWSIVGFLGRDEHLGEVIARDGAALDRLGLSPERLGGALERILDTAYTAQADRITDAAKRCGEALRASGKRGVEGELLLNLGPSLDAIEEGLAQGTPPAPEHGASVEGLWVFLEVRLGYQPCPFTILHRPWSDETPPLPLSARVVDGVLELMAVPGCAMPCRPGESYRHGELDFLIFDPKSGQHLRGAGLMGHLIRAHHFFEGAESPYRLDPQRVAQVLSPHATKADPPAG